MIESAAVSPGHGGDAELVVAIRFANGGLGTVTLPADAAHKLLSDCGVSSVDRIAGQPWTRLLRVLR